VPSKEYTDKNQYKSKYSDQYVTGAQYLAEFICERIAEKDGKKLPYKFWNTEEWKKIFQLQIIKANELLKVYRVGVILKALQLPQAKRIYSLGLKKAIEPLAKQIIKKEQNALKDVFISPEAIEDMKEWTPRPLPTRKNLIGDLDG
jgi:hypothetical protein